MTDHDDYRIKYDVCIDHNDHIDCNHNHIDFYDHIDGHDHIDHDHNILIVLIKMIIAQFMCIY